MKPKRRTPHLTGLEDRAIRLRDLAKDPEYLRLKLRLGEPLTESERRTLEEAQATPPKPIGGER